MSGIPSFLKKEGNKVLYNGEGEFVFYVPEIYFERGYAIMYGDIVNLIGVLDYAIFNKSGKHSGLKTFRFPSVFLTRPGKMEKIKNIQLTSSSQAQDYRMLKYVKNDVVIVSDLVPQSVDNAEEFYKILTSGKLSNTVKYDEIHDYIIENMQLNGGSYGLNMQIFGVVVGELARDSKDRTKLFRHTDMKDMTNYQMIPITEAPKYVSPYTAVTSENWDESLANAIVNKSAGYSPLETLFMD